MASYEAVNTAIPEEERSYFDGGYLAYIGYTLVAVFVSLITLGIAFPWMCCLFQRWKARHTVICGKRMEFDGTGLQLIGNYLLWMFLSVLTFGVYSLWMTISVKKWIAKHTHYQGEEDNNSYFDGGVLGMIGTNLLAGIVLAVPFVGVAWSAVIKRKWEASHTVVDSRRHIFVGPVGGLFVKKLLWGLLTAITLGIYGLFVPIKQLRWDAEYTIDNEHTTQEMIARGEYRANVHADASAFKTCKVEDDMECVKAGITDAMPEDELQALANSGIRVAQYTYAVRYSNGQYTQEPFSGMLRAAAEAEYAPAMSMYLQTHPVDASVRADMLRKGAEKGQIWAIKTAMTELAQAVLARKEDKDALPELKSVVRYADLLREAQEALTAEEETLVKKCIFAIRRIQSRIPPSNGGKTAGVVIGILVGLPIAIALIAGIVVMIMPMKQTDHVEQTMGGGTAIGSGVTDEVYDTDAAVGNGADRGILDMIAGLFGGEGNRYTGAMVDQNQAVVADPDADGELQNTGTSAFWERFLRQMEEDHCVVKQVDTASNGAVKYEITCNYWYWSSLHYIEVLQTADGVERICFWGQRVLEPDSPDPTMNEMQWESIIRVIFKELELGDYDGIAPYKGDGSHTDTFGQWDFSYDNSAQDVRVTISKH